MTRRGSGALGYALLALAALTLAGFAWSFPPALILYAVAAAFGVRAYRRRVALVWRGEAPEPRPLVFVEPRLAVAPSIFGHAVPEGYRLASLYFGTGLIDRSETLDHGFRYHVLDRIPTSRPTPPLAALLDARARALRQRSDAEDAPLRLLWSGGVDSTAAACALMRAFADAPGRLEIFWSAESRAEYPWFFTRHVRGWPARRKIKSVREAFQGRAIVTTGEHGDQLFGSMKALALDAVDLAAPWPDRFPRVLAQELGEARRADAVMAYLSPQIAAAPAEAAPQRLFDLLWWLNFSLKWQAVSLRMLADGDPKHWAAKPRTHHFFQTEGFQLWALANADKRIRGGASGFDWPSYKWPLKDAIYAFTADAAYRDAKEKEPSLRGRMGRRPWATRGLALGVAADGEALYQPYDRSLALAAADKSGDGEELGIEFQIGSEREKKLWAPLDDADGGGE